MNNTIKVFLIFLGVTITIMISSLDAEAQRRVIQFSGVVIGEDSTSGVPGVHVYVPKAGRGTTSNDYGYFSMPVLIGDSVVISAVGYQKQHYTIPGDQGESITAIIELLADTTYLPIVEIFPYPTEELFKEAILALDLPGQFDEDSDNMGEEVLARMFREMPMDGSMNHTYYMDQQFNRTSNRFMSQDPKFNNPLFNPFNWAKFIQSIKRGDLKKKKK